MKIREEKRGERVKRICQSNERRKVHGAKVAQRSEEKKNDCSTWRRRKSGLSPCNDNQTAYKRC